jgi:hypothetical protein
MPSEKLNAQIQFFGYNAARSARPAVKRPGKFGAPSRSQVERQLPNWIFSVSSFSG